MLPATFAPMILKLILPRVTDHFMKVFKMDKLLRYMEEENETDLKVKKQEEQIQLLATELGKTQDLLEKIEILNAK